MRRPIGQPYQLGTQLLLDETTLKSPLNSNERPDSFRHKTCVQSCPCTGTHLPQLWSSLAPLRPGLMSTFSWTCNCGRKSSPMPVEHATANRPRPSRMPAGLSHRSGESAFHGLLERLACRRRCRRRPCRSPTPAPCTIMSLCIALVPCAA